MKIVDEEDSGFQIEEDDLPTTTTFGRILDDGTVLEIADLKPDGMLRLTCWDGERVIAGFRIERGGRAYQVGCLHASLQAAIRWPRGLAPVGRAPELREELSALFVDGQFLLRPEGEVIASLVLGTWVRELMPVSPTVWISGMDMARAMEFFSVLHCVCYHPMVLTRITADRLSSLPPGLAVTPLVNQKNLTVGMRNLLRDASFRGVGVLGSRGTILNFSYPKVIFVGTQLADLPTEMGHLHLALLPVESSPNSCDPQTLDKIAGRFQSRLSRFRVDAVRRARQSGSAGTSFKSPNGAVLGKMIPAGPADPDPMSWLAPLMQSQSDLTITACTLESVLVEVLWSHVHPKGPERAPAEIQIKDLADLVNTVLRTRDEWLEYNAVDVGLRLSALGQFTEKRYGGGKFLVFDLATRQQIHRLARRYKIAAPVVDCPDCSQDSPASG